MKNYLFATSLAWLMFAASVPSYAIEQTPDCIFPDSLTQAPNWVCDEPVKGNYSFTQVGSAREDKNNPHNQAPAFYRALSSALVTLSRIAHTKISNTQTNELIGKMTGSVQTSELASTKNIKIESSIRALYLHDAIQNEKIIDQFNFARNRLTINCPKPYTLVTYARITGNETQSDELIQSSESGKRCDKDALIKVLAEARYVVIDTVTSPKGNLYLLLGVKQH